MDTSDPGIQFDDNGVCNYCVNFETNIKPSWHPSAVGNKQLIHLANAIREDEVGLDFDCIIGLSGGLDSSYTVYIAKE